MVKSTTYGRRTIDALGACLCGAIALVLLAAVDAAAESGPAPPTRAVSPWFVYQGDKSIELLRPQADVLSSISVAGGCPKAFVDQCHKLGIEVYILVGGHDGAVFASPEARRKLIESYIERCRAADADGIDLDFESLDRACRDNYSTLLREGAAAFHAAGKKLSMCVSYIMCTWRSNAAPPAGADEIDGGWYDPKVVGETCDMVRVMCYDMFSPSGGAVGPVSTRPWARDAMRFWMRHVSADKLVMGLPAYSRDFSFAPKPSMDSPYAPAPKLPAGTPVKCLWLAYESVRQYRYTASDGVEHLFFASDASSTRSHLETATELGLRRIGFWHYSAVTAEQWAAVRGWTRAGK